MSSYVMLDTESGTEFILEGLYAACGSCRAPADYYGGALTVRRQGPNGTIWITPHFVDCALVAAEHTEGAQPE